MPAELPSQACRGGRARRGGARDLREAARAHRGGGPGDGGYREAEGQGTDVRARATFRGRRADREGVRGRGGTGRHLLRQGRIRPPPGDPHRQGRLVRGQGARGRRSAHRHRRTRARLRVVADGQSEAHLRVRLGLFALRAHGSRGCEIRRGRRRVRADQVRERGHTLP